MSSKAIMLLKFVLIHLLVSPSLAQFDLCIFFGTCNNNNNRNIQNNNNFNARNDPGPEFIQGPMLQNLFAVISTSKLN